MQKKYLSLLLLLLSGCLSLAVQDITVEEDKFKGETFICSQSISEFNTTISYKICRYKKADGTHKDFIYGAVEYASPVPLEYKEAIDVNKQKLKVTSKDDRRLGMTINQFSVILPEGYIYKNDDIEIKIYGVSHNAILKVSMLTVMALREKIKEIEANQTENKPQSAGSK